MPKLVKIHMREVFGKVEIILDWDNDRHQAVLVENPTPDRVKAGLLDLARLLGKEIAGRNL